VNGHSGTEAITEMWRDTFSKLLNSCHTDNIDTSSSNHSQSNCTHFERFKPNEIYEAVKSVKCGKSQGLDNLYGEHLKYASDKICVLVALLFNCMVIHGHLSSEFMDTIIVPLVKDK